MKYFALFASSATLLCCALPALLVTLGFGAVMASLVSTLPVLVTLSEHKKIIFIVSALMIGVAAFMTDKRRECPVDGNAESCSRLKALSGKILMLSAIVWGIGFFSAFILPAILTVL